ncbi:ABC transporter permease [Hyphomicrobium sp.]|uniref:ABC transporter permease n=1 Tax=Hyphomicrobium sp. TaxID=82 RepID=UPI002E36732D|nr:ABC transporter permease [Hyphomicrobium sp.]HEX2842072.1 ABC transporter permease [Hyphomicrobium sp.]
MPRALDNIFRLGIKELYSLRSDPVMVFLILYTFTIAIYTVANGVKTEVRNASIGVVDEDQSNLSRQFTAALLKPYFKPPQPLSHAEIDDALDSGRQAFVVDIPPKFEADILAGRTPTVQISVDATAMTLAGNGTTYVQSILSGEVLSFLERDSDATNPIAVVVRSRFNPNLESSWFTAIMQIINNVTMLSMILAGAAVIREREHGTIEHLLVMPVTPNQIMLAKVWANGIVILAAVLVSLTIVVKIFLGVEINGSLALFALGTAAFLFAMTSFGITLATVARSMPQFGLLAIPFFVVMNMLSGGVTPLEAMPEWLRAVMLTSPSTHYTTFAQAVLLRGAGLDIVWPQLLAIASIGAALFGYALLRFRASMAAAR